MYTADEVRALIEWWPEFRHSDRLWVLVRYADLSSAIEQMPPREYHAVLLHGLLARRREDAGDLLGVNERTITKRYISGIDWITEYLNGGNR